MGRLFRLTFKQSQDASREDLAAHITRQISNLARAAEVGACVDGDTAEEATINGCLDFVIERLINQNDGVQQAGRIGSRLLEIVAAEKRKAAQQ